MKNLTWQNPEQLFVAQELINKVKSKCCGIKVKEKFAEYEKEILVLHVSDYTNTDKVILLSSLSVGKYSNEYWKAETTTRAASTSQIVKADLLGAAKGIWKNKFVICVCAVGGVQSVLIAAGRSALPSAIGYSAAQWFIG